MRAVEADAVPLEQCLGASITPRLEEIRGSPDELAADEDLRDGLDAGARGERAADRATAVSGLELDRVEIDGTVGDAEMGHHAPHRPAEFAPLEREHDHRVRAIGERLR